MHIPLRYFETRSVCPVWDSREPQQPRSQGPPKREDPGNEVGTLAPSTAVYLVATQHAKWQTLKGEFWLVRSRRSTFRTTRAPTGPFYFSWPVEIMHSRERWWCEIRVNVVESWDSLSHFHTRRLKQQTDYASGAISTSFPGPWERSCPHLFKGWMTICIG